MCCVGVKQYEVNIVLNLGDDMRNLKETSEKRDWVVFTIY